MNDLYEIRIFECKNGIRLMKALRTFNRSFTMVDAKEIVDNIRNNKPFIADSFYSPQDILFIFGDSAEFSYEFIPDKNKYLLDSTNEDEQNFYTEARLWYDALSRDDQQKVDTLIMHSMPRA